MQETCLFCRLIAGQEKAWKIYETEGHVAFLTPFPNTPGFTVLVPKEHLGSDVFTLEDERYTALFLAAREVTALLKKSLICKRVGLIAEGMAIDHAHLKLIPMHGIPDGPWQPMVSGIYEFQERYDGYLSAGEGPRMPDAELDQIQERILRAAG
ncbi:MAG TPA: HIT family protein [Candidatus Kapabacteria bacterium]|nr:HIT family protein [Candidatus Kapabacteria bacterium]